MHTVDELARVDLNLLRALDALLDQRSVTRAARRLGLSQPAMSHALARLREALGDELLVRSGRDLVLTPRAELLRDRAAAALAAARDVFASAEGFDPAEVEGVVTLVVDDYAQCVVAQRVIEAIRAAAPRLLLVVRPAAGMSLDPALGAGEGDLAVLIGDLSRFPPGLHHKRLRGDTFVTAMRAGHPAAGRLDLARFCSLDHVLISWRGHRHGVVDEVLAAQGRRRRVAVVVPSFALVPAVLAGSDAVTTVSRAYLTVMPECRGLHVEKAPITLPEGQVTLLWHARTHRDPVQRWVREQVASVVRELPPVPV
jgi:DNA-binding transcriptional LysR family regulator